jgi:prepilin-type N-terminal cleavage/methylation domain-containing protein
MKSSPSLSKSHRSHAFALPELLVVVAVLLLALAIALPIWTGARARSRQAQCTDNLRQIANGVLTYAGKNNGQLPQDEPISRSIPPPPLWWFYKETIKGEMDLKGPSSPADKVFGCPDDRGYEEHTKPFRLSAKFDYNSYPFNGVNLPGIPNIAGKPLASIKEPAVTLLVMEFTAHGPLSWHRSRTGKKNQPFYKDAESVVGFVDGHVDFVPIYYDGMNPAFTRDPIPGYKYRYSGE